MSATDPPKQTKAISLHIGVNHLDPAHYAGWRGELQWCEEDARDLRLLAHKAGFATNLLLTEMATRSTVTACIRSAAHALDKGDLFLLTFSGHGGQLLDEEGFDEEEDHKDETRCLYDGQILDDEFYMLWSEFKPGVRISIFIDSCHSGTGSKGDGEEEYSYPKETPELRYRSMTPDKAIKTALENTTFYTDIQSNLPEVEPAIQAHVIQISACQDDQLCYEASVEGKATGNGLFTRHLKVVWNKGGFDGSYNHFRTTIARRMPRSQRPNLIEFGGDDSERALFEASTPFTP